MEQETMKFLEYLLSLIKLIKVEIYLNILKEIMLIIKTWKLYMGVENLKYKKEFPLNVNTS